MAGVLEETLIKANIEPDRRVPYVLLEALDLDTLQSKFKATSQSKCGRRSIPSRTRWSPQKINKLSKSNRKPSQYKSLKYPKTSVQPDVRDCHILNSHSRPAEYVQQIEIECKKCSVTFLNPKELYFHQKQVHENQHLPVSVVGFEEVVFRPSDPTTYISSAVATYSKSSKLQNNDLNLDRNQIQRIPSVVLPDVTHSALWCSVCPQTFTTEDEKQRHEYTHGDKCPCPFCPGVFADTAGLNLHKIRAHQGEKLKFTCKVCDCTLLTSLGLKNHYNKFHNYDANASPSSPVANDDGDTRASCTSYANKCQKFICELCGISLLSSKGLSCHTRIVHKSYNANVSSEAQAMLTSPVKYSCKVPYQTPMGLKNNLKTTNQELNRNPENQTQATATSSNSRLKSTCKVCGMSFLTSIGLKHHLTKVHCNYKANEIPETHTRETSKSPDPAIPPLAKPLEICSTESLLSSAGRRKQEPVIMPWWKRRFTGSNYQSHLPKAKAQPCKLVDKALELVNTRTSETDQFVSELLGLGFEVGDESASPTAELKSSTQHDVPVATATTSPSLSHTEDQHSENGESPRLFSCQNCPMTFSNRPMLFSHQESYCFSKNTDTSRLSNRIIEDVACESTRRFLNIQRITGKRKVPHVVKPNIIFRCPLCSKIFLEMQEAVQHQQSHTEEQGKGGIVNQLKIPKIIFKCPLCAKTFSKLNEAAEHERSHLENGDKSEIPQGYTDKSQFCSKLLKNVDDMISHAKLEHPDVFKKQVEDKDIPETEGPTETPGIKRVHITEDGRVLEVGNYRDSKQNSQNSQNHLPKKVAQPNKYTKLLVSTPIPETISQPGQHPASPTIKRCKIDSSKWQCGICDLRFFNQKQAFTHLNSHNGGYKCPCCLAVFVQPIGLSTHQTRAHPDIRFEHIKAKSGDLTTELPPKISARLIMESEDEDIPTKVKVVEDEILVSPILISNESIRLKSVNNPQLRVSDKKESELEPPLSRVVSKSDPPQVSSIMDLNWDTVNGVNSDFEGELLGTVEGFYDSWDPLNNDTLGKNDKEQDDSVSENSPSVVVVKPEELCIDEVEMDTMNSNYGPFTTLLCNLCNMVFLKKKDFIEHRVQEHGKSS